MHSYSDVCSADTARLFLADELAPQERAAYENHLDECPVCQQRLETLSAGENWWSDAKAYLAAVDDPSRRDGLCGLAGYLAPSDDPRMLGRIGKYEILGVVGRGGMGIVLKALDPALDRYVAIKVLGPQLAASAVARQRFAREARAAAAVVHENVLAIHAVAEHSGLPFLVMPYVPGASLEKRLAQEGPLPIEQVLRIAVQVASGLAAAHAQGLVHRDVKPANILLEAGLERVTLTDFGLARTIDDVSVTCTGVIAGTPQYMSPEQARGEPLDHRSDLFSLGSVMYAMCTGLPAFHAESSYGVLQRICESAPKPLRELNPAIPAWLESIIARLQAKIPGDRFHSAADVAALLSRCLAHVQRPLSIPLPPELVEKPHPARDLWPERSLTGVLIAISLVAVLVLPLLWNAGGGAATAPDESPRSTIFVPSFKAPIPGTQPGPAAPEQDEVATALEQLGHDLDQLEQSLIP